MKSTELKTQSISLVIGCFLMIVTMVLHPVGGNFEHLVSIFTVGVVSHAIAILSIPFVTYGFWGLTEKISTPIAKLSFVFMAFGLMAVMLAGTVNGIVLMNFVQSYADASQETIASLKPIFRLLFDLNHAFDFIFIGAVYISTLLWSISIIKTKILPISLGWFGTILSLAGIVASTAGFVFVDVTGFRIFIFSWVAWVIWCGIAMIKSK
ncbi:MAG: hypothetical protein AAF391_02940 [Bacteroidota bacterium]